MMILTQLKHYLQSVPLASLCQISQQLGVTSEVANDMLALWQRKGKVRKVTTCQRACGNCTLAQADRYQWIDSSNASAISSIRVCSE